MAPVFAHIDDLEEEGKSKFGIQLRVVRLYEQPRFNNKDEIVSLELILHDKMGKRVHATIQRRDMDAFKKILKVGKVLLLMKYIVVSNNKNTIDCVHKILIFKYTSICEVNDTDFPNIMYNFKKFDEISAIENTTACLLFEAISYHARFRIPINVNEDSTCNIKQGSSLAELIVRCKLIIWDEAPMMHKYCFEALDKSLRDIMRFVDQSSETKPFGGKTVVFGGDFRQILPVIPKGSRQDIVFSAISSSYIWENCKVLRLTKNMRLQHIGHNEEALEIEQFSKWIADIGDGTIGGPNDGYAEIDIPNDILVKCSGDPIASIVNSTYPDYSTDTADTNYLQENNSCSNFGYC